VAFSAGSNGSGSRRPGRGVLAMSEINVTPFVDVVLVLLIIFMLTAHVIESGIDINVPKTQKVAQSTKDLPIVEISKTGEVYFGKNPAPMVKLAGMIRQKYGDNPAAVYIRADAETPWDPIAQVMSILSDAKLPVSIVTQPADSHARH
jgi:biopolymer transport protein ExbD